MLFLRKIFYISIYTNILIALAAMAQCALTYIIFERPINWSIVLVEGQQHYCSTTLAYGGLNPKTQKNQNLPARAGYLITSG
ncbi:hypothetical protein KUH03_23535 [Sphingobacterium sp. E70]|uniref:hypothetical protein n=1 Tax=Sphingobacterium sp. E70 TaxID=2853439 RepID=UPI00211CEFAD|nr:hypothetical protein [Sphingobacterium sp. E70]ULT22395.1 hypothetical protein KUH03_23535 [Sphingobacterium sp. E70]